MITTLFGNIATELKSNYVMKNGQYVMDQQTGKWLIATEFYLAVSRDGKNKKGLDGKEYTSDLYRVRAIGRTAESLVQYGSKGRSIVVTGHMLQDEWNGNQTVSIDPQHPLYQTLAQFTAMPNSVVKADAQGTLYFVAKAPIKSITIDLTQYNWASGNPNSQNYSPANFTPNQGGQPAMPSMAPAVPGMPAMPNMPVQGQQPAVPGMPAMPPVQGQAPVVPGVPAMPNVPAMPSVPAMPNMPAMPNVPNVPFGSDAQGTVGMNVPNVPNVPVMAPNAGYQVVQGQTNPTAGTVPAMPGYNAPSVVPDDFTNIPNPPAQGQAPAVPATANQAPALPNEKAPQQGQAPSEFKPDEAEDANKGF